MTSSDNRSTTSNPSNSIVETFERVELLHAAVADAFCELIAAAVEQRGVAKISLSGGSTPKVVYQMLAERDLPWNQIHWFWGDERNVPADSDESNQKMVREALLSRVAVPESNIHAVPVDVNDPGAAASQYEQTMRQLFGDATFPCWDLALLGMGDDAHTASLFPGTKALDEETRWFVENWVEKFDGYRYTLTAPAINSARESWFLISGSGKREALKNVWEGPKRPDEFPSQLIKPTRWFVTRDARAEA